jgi:predicted nucleic acid-binding protein
VNSIIALDAGPLGLISNPNSRSANRECFDWLKNTLARGCKVYLPEIADYEIRRELIRANKRLGLTRLDYLKNTLVYLPITTQVMLHAAELWATARKKGHPTADPKALDCDVILAAQALQSNAIVATENIGHLSRFVVAKHWREIES